MKKPFSPFRIKKSDDQQFYFVGVGKNGEDVVTSEMHPTRQICKRSIHGFAKDVAEAWNNNNPLVVDETTAKR